MLPARTRERLETVSKKVPKEVVSGLKKLYDIGQEGKGLKVAGSGLSLAGSGQYGGGLKVAGSGLSLAGAGMHGGALSLAGQGDMLPGEELKKKLLKKMVRQKRMEAIGDRIKTKPISSVGGAGLVLAGSSSGQSMGKTYEGMKGYKMRGHPLGAGMKKGKMEGGFLLLSLGAIIGAISTAASAAMATTVGTTTVGALVGTAALGAAGSAGAAAGKKLVEKVAGKGIKEEILDTVKKTKLQLKDLPSEAKKIIMTEYDKLKEKPTKKGLVKLGVKIAPLVKKALSKKVPEKLQLGSGLKLAGQGEDKFTKEFTKEFVGELA